MKFKSTLKLLTSSVLMVIVVALFRQNFAYDGIGDDLSAWGVFFTVFGVLYAIVAGFVLISVLERYNSLSSTLEEELNALQDVRDFLHYLDNQEATRKNIRNALVAYADAVTDKEWQEMSNIAHRTDSDTSEELKAIIVEVSKVKVGNESDSVALQSLIEKVSSITTLRTKRISIADSQLPPRLQILLGFMSLVLVAGFVAMGVQNVYVHMFMVVSTVVAVHLTYMITSDLNTPFEGTWNIENTYFAEFSKRLKD